jgi:hypothetical protein
LNAEINAAADNLSNGIAAALSNDIGALSNGLVGLQGNVNALSNGLVGLGRDVIALPKTLIIPINEAPDDYVFFQLYYNVKFDRRTYQGHEFSSVNLRGGHSLSKRGPSYRQYCPKMVKGPLHNGLCEQF